MNCETFTRFDTSSLYKNGRLIAQAGAIFLIRRCQDVELNISAHVFCCNRNRNLRVIFTVKNIGADTLKNTLLLINISPACHCCPCRNNIYREYAICNLLPNNSNTYHIDIPFPCNMHYTIKGKIVRNNVLLKEECRVI